jgi:riboflavin biosynthesis pyrimidine reductase
MTLQRLAPDRVDRPASRPDQPWPVEALWQSAIGPSDGGVRGGELPAELRTRYAAPLEIPLRLDRPTIVANFVSTLDGVVALDRVGASSGQHISGGFEPDRFVMGLLRTLSDAVVVGAGTVRASRTHGWTPRHVHPASGPAFDRWRTALGLDPAGPVTVIVSASGALQEDHLPVDPASPVIVATTASGARRLKQLRPARHIEVASLGGAESIPMPALVEFLDSRRLRLLLSEGGPALFGRLLDAGLVDEAFLTLAPQLAGRSSAVERLSLVEGVAFTPPARWGQLRSVMRAADHLFLRYQLAHLNGKDLS